MIYKYLSIIIKHGKSYNKQRGQQCSPIDHTYYSEKKHKIVTINIPAKLPGYKNVNYPLSQCIKLQLAKLSTFH